MKSTRQRLLFLGMILFLIGLLSGLVVTEVQNPRMGLAAHLEAVMNGMFLLAAGLAWPRMSWTPTQEKLTFAMLVYGAFANFFIIQASSVIGASAITPIAGQGFMATGLLEMLLSIGLVTVAVAMITAVILMVIGLYRYQEE